MGYQIVYDQGRNQKSQEKAVSSRLWIYTVVFLAIFVVMLPYVWSEGADFLRDMIFHGDVEALQNGYEAFLSALDSGQSVGEGLVVFCEQVIAAGNLGA